MAFTSLNPFRVNRRLLPNGLAEIRLITMVAAIATLAQWVVPVGARYALNGGRIYYADDVFALWPAVLPWPVLDVPAWLTIVTGLVAIVGATVYFLRGGSLIAGDIYYVLIVTLLACAFVPWFIAALNTDPTGIIRTPEPDAYPIGWHWVISPLCIVPVVAAIVAARRAARRRADARVERLARMRARAEQGDDGVAQG